MGWFYGMRGSGNFETNEAPEDWNEKILELFPNGSVTLTAILSKAKKKKADDTIFHWFTRTLSSQRGAVTSVYIDVGLATEYTYAGYLATHGQIGSTVYAKVAEATADMFRPGHTALLRDSAQYTVDVLGLVTAVVKNGASSYIAVKLREVDDNHSTAATYNIATVDTILIAGNSNAQGAAMPEALTTDPTEIYNYTGIARTPLDITRTARKTKLRTRDAYLDAKKEALLYHGIEREKNAIWGLRFSGTGSNGKSEKTSGGLLWFIKTYASSNVDDYSLSTSYSGKTWLQSGEEWLDGMVETWFKYGDGQVGGEKLVLCGSGALQGIQKIIKTYGNYQIGSDTIGYGIKVKRWETVFGDLLLKTHPLFSLEPTNRYSMLVLEPGNITRRIIDDTFFKKDTGEREGGYIGVDGTKEEFLTEDGLQIEHPEMFGYGNGVGVDNSL